jgi:hypothetical protein
MSFDFTPHSIKYEVLHPVTNEPIGLILDLVGTDSDEWYDWQLEQARKWSSTGATKATEITSEQIKQSKESLLADCIVDWRVTKPEINTLFQKFGFENSDYSKEKAVALVSAKNMKWLHTQIDTVFSDKQRFFKTPSVN